MVVDFLKAEVREQEMLLWMSVDLLVASLTGMFFSRCKNTCREIV